MDLINHYGGVLANLEMFPYFDLAHYTLACMIIRDDDRLLPDGTGLLSRKHPFASWLCSLMMCFAGAIVGNLLTGDPVLAPFMKDNNVIIATAVWYFVNYSPFDISYQLMSLLPNKAILFALKEVHRVHKIRQAVQMSLSTYPHAYFVAIILGTIKGAAGNYVRFIQRPMIGIWNPASNDILRPSFITKASCLAASIFLLEFTGYLQSELSNAIFLLVISFILFFRLTALLTGGQYSDPFEPVERVICTIFFGGIWDALQQPSSSSSSSGKKQQ